MEKIKPFMFFEGGVRYVVTDIIDDGKEGFELDQDELDILRFEGEGGLCNQRS